MTYALLLGAIRNGDDGEGIGGRLVATQVPSENPTRATDDTILVARIQAGDGVAFDTVFHRWWGALWRFARAELHSPALAEDVVQQVFANLWTNAARWAPTQGIQAYLYGAVRNAIIDRRRHDHVVREYAATILADPACETARDPSPATSAEQNDLLARLASVLRQLPDVRRQGVLLRYEHGLSYQQIASVLGITPAAAEKQILRTLMTLRAELDG